MDQYPKQGGSEQAIAEQLGLNSWALKDRGYEMPGQHKLPDGRTLTVEYDDTERITLSDPRRDGDDYRDDYELHIFNDGDSGSLSMASRTAEGRRRAQAVVGFRSGELTGSFWKSVGEEPQGITPEQVARLGNRVLSEIEDAMGAVAAMQEVQTRRANADIDDFIEG